MELPLTSDAPYSEILLKEYDAHRKEMSESIAETRALERYAVAATAAIWTWLLIQSAEKPWVGLIKWIPLALCVLAALRCSALFVDIRYHANSLRALRGREANASVRPDAGFAIPRRWYPAATAVVIWLVLLVGNLYLCLHLNPQWFGAIKG